jgi:hypothetical protein
MPVPVLRWHLRRQPHRLTTAMLVRRMRLDAYQPPCAACHSGSCSNCNGKTCGCFARTCDQGELADRQEHPGDWSGIL